MFGIIRPCRHRLGDELHQAWRAHLCGMCLALRDGHGQLARLATNYDGLVISVMAEAQAPAGTAPGRRQAGPCPLRGMRRASVADGDAARLAATVSLVLAAAKARDHAADGDGLAGYPGARRAAAALARAWEERGQRAGAALGFDARVLTRAVARQQELEAQAGPGTGLLAITEPTETATAAAFGHTAILAGRPANQAPLAQAGRLFGRIAHLLDAAEDLPADQRAGAWNPLAATGASLPQARQLCEDALAGITLALAGADFTDRRLVDALLGTELRHAVRRVFGPQAGHACAAGHAHGGHHAAAPARQAGLRSRGGALLRPALGLLAVAGLCAASGPPGPAVAPWPLPAARAAVPATRRLPAGRAVPPARAGTRGTRAVPAAWRPALPARAGTRAPAAEGLLRLRLLRVLRVP